MNIVSLTDYAPIPRYDNTPWTRASIQEAASPDTPDADWDELLLVNLLPLDSDPEHPMSRDFTFSGTEGLWYRVVFIDGTGKVMLPTDPLQNVPDETLPYLPTVADIGALLRTRTKDAVGNEVGTFNNDTRPTAEEVQALIEQAARDVTAVTDTDIPPGAYEEVKQAIIVRAAMKVELSFFSDQVNSGRSVYLQLRDEYRDARGTGLLKDAFDAVKREAEEVIIGELPEAVRPRSGFPEADRRLDYGRPL